MSKKLEMTTKASVSSVSATDRLYVERGGTLEPVSFETLAKAVRETVKVGGRNLLSGTDTLNHQANIARYGAILNGGVPFSSVGLNIGEEITFSLLVENTTTKDLVASMEWYNSDSSRTGIDGEGSVTPGETKRISVTGTIPAGYAKVRLRVNNLNPANDTTESFTFKECKLERGNMATDWSPAPEDLESAISGGVESNTLYAQSAGQEGGSHELAYGTYGIKVTIVAGDRREEFYLSRGSNGCGRMHTVRSLHASVDREEHTSQHFSQHNYIISILGGWGCRDGYDSYSYISQGCTLHGSDPTEIHREWGLGSLETVVSCMIRKEVAA